VCLIVADERHAATRHPGERRSLIGTRADCDMIVRPERRIGVIV
jgi:hypothetical protein